MHVLLRGAAVQEQGAARATPEARPCAGDNHREGVHHVLVRFQAPPALERPAMRHTKLNFG